MFAWYSRSKKRQEAAQEAAQETAQESTALARHLMGPTIQRVVLFLTRSRKTFLGARYGGVTPDDDWVEITRTDYEAALDLLTTFMETKGHDV